MYVDGITVRNENGSLKGEEVNMLTSFIRRINASVEIHQFPPPKNFTDFDVLLDESLDFPFVRRFPTVEMLDGLHLITPFIKDNLLAVIPQSSMIPPYIYILMIYGFSILLILTIFTISAAVIIHFGNYLTVGDAFFKVLSCFFGSGIRRFSTRPESTKIIFFSAVFFSVFNSVLFQTSLTSTLLTKKFEPDLDTLTDLANSNLTIYVEPNHYYLLPKRLKDRAIQTTNEEISKMMNNGSKNAFVVLETFIKLQIQYREKCFKCVQHFNNHYHVMRQSIVPGYNTYIFSKNNLFIDKISEYLQAIARTAKHRSFNEWRSKIYASQVEVLERFTFEHWISIFATVIIGHFIASVIFLIELIVYYFYK